VDELPDWPEGTVAVLSTGGGDPHAIPVSTAFRAGPRAVMLGLALGRESLARLRREPACALTVLAAGDLAFTALGRAAIVDEGERMAAVRIDVERIQDHGTDRFVVDDGVRWRWTDADAERADAAVREALRAL
jgi:nitroimidazol reductase NimA-like FMN-containing flavoprotein (pyridoxamine 5'-phosphate oxidase superfamily)